MGAGGILIFSLLATRATSHLSLSCDSLAGNLPDTRGCQIIPNSGYFSIECERAQETALKKMLKKYRQFGCDVPLSLTLHNSPFIFKPDLLHDVRSSLYRLRLYDLAAEQSLRNLFRGMKSLKMVTLAFVESPHRNSSEISAGVFHGIHHLEYLELLSKAPIRFLPDSFRALANLQCIRFTGTQPSCTCQNQPWTSTKNNPSTGTYRDELSGRTETCRFRSSCVAKRCEENR